MQGSLEVSDPWDFPQVGRIPVVVLATSPRESLVRFEAPLAYRGSTYDAARLHPRHAGGEFAPASSPLPVNVALLHSPDEIQEPAADSDRVFMIGVFRFGP